MPFFELGVHQDSEQVVQSRYRMYWVTGEMQRISGGIEEFIPADALADYRAYIQDFNLYVERERQITGQFRC